MSNVIFRNNWYWSLIIRLGIETCRQLSHLRFFTYVRTIFILNGSVFRGNRVCVSSNAATFLKYNSSFDISLPNLLVGINLSETGWCQHSYDGSKYQTITRIQSCLGWSCCFWYVFVKDPKRYIAIEIHQKRLGLANCSSECNTRFAIPEEGESDTLTFRSFSSISV